MYDSINPFVLMDLEAVSKSLKKLYFNRKVRTNYYPSSMLVATPDNIKKYHDETREHWNDEDISGLATNYNQYAISFLNSVNESNVPFWMVDPDALLTVNDVTRLCKRNGVTIEDYNIYLADVYQTLKWFQSDGPEDCFLNLFSDEYAKEVNDRIWKQWL